MKALTTIFTLILTASLAQAAGGMQPLAQCTGRDDHGQKIDIAAGGGYQMMVIYVNGKKVVTKGALLERHPNQLYYSSPTFTNKNNAPSSLTLLVYNQNGQLQGTAYEASYVPEFLLRQIAMTCTVSPF